MRPLVRDAMQSSAVVERKARKEQEAEIEARRAGSKPTLKADAYAAKNATTKHEKADAAEEADTAPQPTKPEGKAKKNIGPEDFATYSASAPRRLNDIVQAPPELKKLPRGAKQGQLAKAAIVGSHSLKDGALSMAQKAKLEEERERAIKAYRELRGRTAVG